MGSEIEITETPNWLKELEAKRERRLKTKLGHELGAGAPCLTCEDKCPGLDLHFWRKICKNCKCSKENHEVQDDDIYGWAQDELLGTKVNRLKRKIVLPGRKDKEVELEWAPNGQKETIDKYLKTVPPELLPIKGSQAAQDRKQMLKKQIPIHDIDPTLCHELSDEELRKMQEYVAHIKQSSVGVGHLIQINFSKGKMHVMDKNDAMFLINNVPKGIVSSENVILQGGDSSVPLKNLANKFGGLELREPASFEVLQAKGVSGEIQERHPVYPGFKDKQYGVNNVLDPLGNRVVTEDVQVPQETCLRDLSYTCDDYPVSPVNTGEISSDSQRLEMEHLVPSAFVPIKQPGENYNETEGVRDFNEGSVKELAYPSQFVEQHKYRSNLPYYNPGNVHTVEEHQNPAYFQPIKDLGYDTNQNEGFQRPDNVLYAPQSSYDPNLKGSQPNSAFAPSSPFRTIDGVTGSPSSLGRDRLYQPQPQNELSKSQPNRVGFEGERVGKSGKLDENLPHFGSGKTVSYENLQTPVKIRNVKDLAHSTYDSPPDGVADDFHNLSVKERLNKLKQKELEVLGPRNSPILDRTMSPSKFSMKDRVMNLTPSYTNTENQGYGAQNSPSNLHTPSKGSQGTLPHEFDPTKPNYGVHSNGNLPAFLPSNQNVYEDDLQPKYIPIGSIRDIEYENPNVRTALSQNNDFFEGSTPNKIEPNLNLAKLPCCHYCKAIFKQEELAITIPERSDAIYHTGCFKCHGCNQILADMFYFYDKGSDNVYCGRDYAKIRGIPRCMACDELIFVKEYCLAENSTFHVKHFCCFECDKPLADQNYVMENNQPVCIPCYELTKANKCYACKEVIHPDQQGLQLKDGVHFHATEDCFACKMCQKSLFGAKLLFRNDCLYCSHDCYNSDL